MRVFVTGATGALGRHLVPGLVAPAPAETATRRQPARGAHWRPAGIRHVEETVPLEAPEGIVLRYGTFYGPGASDVLLEAVRKWQVPVVGGGAGVWSFIEVTDAAAATIAAVGQGAPGIYNVV